MLPTNISGYVKMKDSLIESRDGWVVYGAGRVLDTVSDETAIPIAGLSFFIPSSNSTP